METTQVSSNSRASKNKKQKKPSWRIHTLGFCIVMRINELQLHTTWMNLTNIFKQEKPGTKEDSLYGKTGNTNLCC